jgi:predicted nucleic-acid-binding Zn-ribbon protein
MNKWRLACPACDSEDYLLIGTTVWMKATERGFSHADDRHGISPTSKIKCTKCGYNGFYHELKEHKDG